MSASFRRTWSVVMHRNAALLALVSAVACAPDGNRCDDCGRLVIAAVGDPPSLLPPLVQETVGRDIGAQIFERLLELKPGAAPLDSAAWAPALAESWAQPDDTTVVFTLRAGARWHDGQPVTSADVVFSYEAYTDTTIGAPGSPSLDGVTLTAVDARTVRATAWRPSPELLYDLTYGIRILPKHIWGVMARAFWAQDTTLRHLVGSGPYRLVTWKRGDYLRLVADSLHPARPAIDTLVWRFTPDPTAATTLVLAHEADVVETLITPDNIMRVAADSTLRVQRYPAAVYGFLAWRVQDAAGRPHPVLGMREVRQGLATLLDRPTMATAIFGEGTDVPRGPVSQALWLHDATRAVAGRDSLRGVSLLEFAQWRLGPDGVRQRAGRPLEVEILVPSTSGARQALAQAIVEAWRGAGVRGRVAVVDFAVFQQRLAEGKFDAYIGAYLDEPSPRGLAVQWGSSGIGQLNHGRWADRTFDSLLTRAAAATSAGAARSAYDAAFVRLEEQVPAVWLFAPAAAMGRNARVTPAAPLDPFNWLGHVARWTKGPRAAVQ